MVDEQHEHKHSPPSILSCGHDPDQEISARLAFAAGLTFLIFLAELIGGLVTGSLALLSDAAHVFSDVFALFLSWAARRLALRPPSLRRTFGWHRAEVLAAVINGTTLVIIGLGIIREAHDRLVDPPEILVGPMLIVAIGGLLGNAIVLLRFGKHGHSDLNVRAAYLHVLGDLLASVGVVVAAIVIRLTGLQTVDPVLSIMIALAIIYSSVRLLREGLHILLEGVPHGLKLGEVVEALKKLPGVTEVHHLHVWSLCSNLHALSAHLITCPLDDASREKLLAQAGQVMKERFGIAETTFQVETTACDPAQVLYVSAHGTSSSHNHPRHNH